MKHNAEPEGLEKGFFLKTWGQKWGIQRKWYFGWGR